MDTGSTGHSGKDRQDLTDRKGQTGRDTQKRTKRKGK